MRSEESSGGVVFFGNSILMLKKMNGDWVLPKGKIEAEESEEDTALREVFEETHVKAEILAYIGDIHYTYRNYWSNNEVVDKKVHWYLMTSNTMKCIPQKEEGFKAAKFIIVDRVIELAKYDDEKGVLEKAIKLMEERQNMS